MALIQCPECGKQVSDTARSCPHCGYNLARRHQARKRAVVLLGVVVALIVGIAVYAVYEHELSERAREANEAFLDKCPYNTYLDLYHNINKYSISNEDYIDITNAIRMDEIRDVPFEQSQVYTRWSQYKKYFN